MSKLEKLKEIFFLFAKDGSDGVPGITYKDVKFVVQELKVDIKDNELQMEFDNMFDLERDEEGNVRDDQDKLMLFDDFYKLMLKLQAKKDVYETTLYGLQHLDKEEKGFIDIKYFRYLMNQYGEKMPVEDITDIIKMMDPDVTGKIPTKLFADVLFGKEKPPTKTETEEEKKKKKAKAKKK
jgi:Ca2+-binding EF-hand superfamily protein